MATPVLELFIFAGKSESRATNILANVSTSSKTSVVVSEHRADTAEKLQLQTTTKYGVIADWYESELSNQFAMEL